MPRDTSPAQSERDPRCLDLRHFRDLKKGWDTYDAEPISTQAIRTAEHLTAVPTSSGGIQLEMHAGGVELEIEITSTGRVKGILFETVGPGR